MRTLSVEPISAEAFAPFGHVARHEPGTAVIAVTQALTPQPGGTIPALDWVQVDGGVTLPFTVTRLEHHPFSAQSFLSQSGASYLVIACPKRPDGQPDTAGLRAFIAPGDCAVTYAAGVWHHKLAPLGGPSRFIMTMMRTGRDDDNVFAEIDPVTLRDGS